MQISKKSVIAAFVVQETLLENFKLIALMAWRGESFKDYTLCYSAPIWRIGIKFLEQHLDIIYTQHTKFRVSGSFQLAIN